MRFLLLLFIFSSFVTHAQLTENFTDDNFTEYPPWQGDTSNWRIENGQLKSNSDSISSSFYLCTSSSIAQNCQWEIHVNLKFQTSSANYIDIYLTSEQSNLKSDNNSGYFVRVGNSTDEISLYKKLSGNSIEIIDGENSRVNASNNFIAIKVSRDTNNLWTLKSNTKGAGFPYIIEGTEIDSTIISSNYFGMLVQQSTKSFHKKHFFDDLFIGPITHDSIAPLLLSASIISSNQIDLELNEFVELVNAENANNYIIVNTIENPVSAIRDENNFRKIHLTFAQNFNPDQPYSLQIKNIQDLDENTIKDTSIQFTFSPPETANRKDIVINEIFADPSPQVGLPNAEYIEIFNKSKKAINLEGWKITDKSSSANLSNFVLTSNAFIILCSKSDTSVFQKYGAVMGLSNFPTLNNQGNNLILKNEQNLTIDSVAYTDQWYRDKFKEGGGWSLELMNPDANINCPPENYWAASTSSEGGSPGGKNANYAISDPPFPSIENVEVISNTLIKISFNTSMNSDALHNNQNYTIDHGIRNPVQADSANPKLTSIQLSLKTPLMAGINYSLSISNTMINCAGIPTSDILSFSFIIPEMAMPGDLVINEVLFNPKENGIDFVEIVNRSNKIIDLNSIILSHYEPINDSLFGKENIISNSFLIQPGEYILLSENDEIIRKQYHTTNPTGFINMKNIPSMSDKGASIAISNSSKIIDAFTFSEDMHFPLLKNKEGISLERIDFNRKTEDKTNWHSAAEMVGFASPAYENSQYKKTGERRSPLEIVPEIFSPDEDGRDDIVNINFHFETSGLIGSISIYDSKGRVTRKLVRNELLGVEGSYSWDGINENLEKAKIGIYIIFVEVVDLSGKTMNYKKTCVLAGKL